MLEVITGLKITREGNLIKELSQPEQFEIIELNVVDKWLKLLSKEHIKMKR